MLDFIDWCVLAGLYLAASYCVSIFFFEWVFPVIAGEEDEE